MNSTIESVEQENIVEQKPVYTFRELQADDTFLMFSIISKIGINKITESFGHDNVKAIVDAMTNDKDENKDAAIKKLGISVVLEMANIVLGNLPKCKEDIYQLLANTSNLTVVQIKKLNFAIFTKMVIDFIKKKEFKDFIKVVSASFNPEN